MADCPALEYSRLRQTMEPIQGPVRTRVMTALLKVLFRKTHEGQNLPPPPTGLFMVNYIASDTYKKFSTLVATNLKNICKREKHYL